MQKAALRFLVFLLILALIRDFVANGRPLWCRLEGKNYWPAFAYLFSDAHRHYVGTPLEKIEEEDHWRALYPDHAVYAPIPYSPKQKDAPKLPPGSVPEGYSPRFRHWLGTDELGRDVLSGAIFGIRTAIWTGGVAVLIALLIGGMLGTIAGFWGDQGLRIRRGPLFMLLLGFFPAFWLAFIAPPAGHLLAHWYMEILVFTGVLVLCYLPGSLLARIPFFSKPQSIPSDLIILRLAEMFESIPAMLLLVVVASLIPDRKLVYVMAFIGLISWPGAARYLRAELLRIREMDYIAGARNLGFSEWQVLWRHALPNALQPLLGIFALAMSSAMLLEAALSFLGLADGDLEIVTWGRMLHTAQNQIQLWWVWLPPGLLICTTVLCLFRVSERRI